MRGTEREREIKEDAVKDNGGLERHRKHVFREIKDNGKTWVARGE